MVQLDVPEEFPVVLYNGERQINVGNIEINPTTDFQTFRTMLKQMIGTSYNNLTTYLVENRKPDNQADQHRKTLITSKVDLLVLVREKNGYFLVVLKRSRRERRRKNNNRNCVELSPADLFDYGYESFDPREITTQVAECGKAEIWVHELRMKRANNMHFLMHSLNSCGFLYSDVNANFPSVAEAYPIVERPMTRPLCGECTEAERRGWKTAFHLCVYDDVVEGFFRSPAGPVARPE